MKRIIFAFFIACCAMSRASTVSQSFTFAYSPPPFGFPIYQDSPWVDFQQFDPSLGTLNKVEASVKMTTSMDVGHVQIFDIGTLDRFWGPSLRGVIEEQHGFGYAEAEDDLDTPV